MPSKKRIVIKLSGEVMEQGDHEANLDFVKIKKLAASLKILAKKGYQVGVVIGGGNIFRARMDKKMALDRISADHIGMTATMINAMALQSVLRKIGQPAQALSPFIVGPVLKLYTPELANKYLNKKTIVIFAGGTGKPYFTTDTALVLRAKEVGASDIYKATNVIGVFDKDPDKYKKAKLYRHLTYQEAIRQKLKVMDQAAFVSAQKNNMRLRVFKFSAANIIKAVSGGSIGTKLTN